MILSSGISELRSTNFYIQILCRFQKCKWRVHPLGVKGDFLVQGSDGGGTFCLLTGMYIEFGYKNPSILTQYNLVDV